MAIIDIATKEITGHSHRVPDVKRPSYMVTLAGGGESKSKEFSHSVDPGATLITTKPQTKDSLRDLGASYSATYHFPVTAPDSLLIFDTAEMDKPAEERTIVRLPIGALGEKGVTGKVALFKLSANVKPDGNGGCVVTLTDRSVEREGKVISVSDAEAVAEQETAALLALLG